MRPLTDFVRPPLRQTVNHHGRAAGPVEALEVRGRPPVQRDPAKIGSGSSSPQLTIVKVKLPSPRPPSSICLPAERRT